MPHIAQAGDQRFDFIAFSEQMRREILLLEITIASKSGGAELGDQAHSLEKMIDARMRRTPGSGWRRSNTPPTRSRRFNSRAARRAYLRSFRASNKEYLYTHRTVVNFHGFDETLVAYLRLSRSSKSGLSAS
ncbi:hypothetical protein [Bradyrhizobium sp.]|uniref:hypothetical protein n=1 Tax=Bradyrhizobium sp. TaxID=376 RepID=UPI003D0BA3D2